MSNWSPIWPKGKAKLPVSFNVQLPEIYQIEATCACNMECPMCYRFFGERQYENSYFSLDLARRMVERGDFAGSYFVEFQLSGEPLLHPRLAELVRIVKSAGVKTGLSTNGTLLHPKSRMSQRSLEAVAELDTMTISVDGVDEETYELYRPVVGSTKKGTQGPSFTFTSGELFEVIDLVLAQPKHPVLDLQIIELPGWEVQLEKLLDLCKRRSWIRDDVNVRTTPDSFMVVRGEVSPDKVQSDDLCLNPWLSVTVLSNGTVASCCYDFHGLNKYGDLNVNTLEEIWAGKAVKDLRAAFMSGDKGKLPPLCVGCYLRSPVNIHLKFYRNWSKGGGVYFAPGRESQDKRSLG